MNKYQYNLECFKQINAVSAYLLGAFMTDGCVYYSKDRPNRKVVTLTSKDKDWLDSINQLVCSNKPLLKHGDNCYRIMWNSTAIADWLIKHGCGERKSLTLQFPKIPECMLPYFLCGCWDGDGSLSFTKSGNKGRSFQRQANFTSGSFEFLKVMQAILSEKGIESKIKLHNSPSRKIDGRDISGSNCWRLHLSSGENVYELVKFLYEKCSLAMPRKKEIALTIIADWETIRLCQKCSRPCSLSKYARKAKYCLLCKT